MIRHICFIEVAAGVDPVEVDQVVVRLRSLDALDSVLDIQVGRALQPESSGVRIGLVSDHSSAEELDRYLSDPRHLAASEGIPAIRKSISVLDFDTEAFGGEAGAPALHVGRES